MRPAELESRLRALSDAGLARRRVQVQGPVGATLRVGGSDWLSFCSNDYLGLAEHPAIADAARRALDRYGVGAGASGLVCGHTDIHEQLEHRLAAFVGLPRALHFSTGYMANLGVVPALAGPGDAIFSDRLNHASLIDAARLSRADVLVYPHLDVAQLESMMRESRHPTKLVLTDAVFSMDGDQAPVPRLLELCERHDAWLVVDDAHGFGVLGPDGRGSLAQWGLGSDRIVYVGTLGKAAGVFGAFAAGSELAIEWLQQKARTYMFTTASPPLLAAALLAALDLIESESWRRDRLARSAARVRQAFAPGPSAASSLQRPHLHPHLVPSDTPIQALIIGDNEPAMRLMSALRQDGIWVPAIRPPTVPAGTARLRISLSAAHTDADVDRLVSSLQERIHGLKAG
jgi:8-amino-7-oxononanoate synthase